MTIEMDCFSIVTTKLIRLFKEKWDYSWPQTKGLLYIHFIWKVYIPQPAWAFRLPLWAYSWNHFELNWSSDCVRRCAGLLLQMSSLFSRGLNAQCWYYTLILKKTLVKFPHIGVLGIYDSHSTVLFRAIQWSFQCIKTQVHRKRPTRVVILFTFIYLN